MFRKSGTLLPLGRRLLEPAVAHAERGVYGLALAQELAGTEGETKLVAHGTMCKALDRMRRAGWLTAAWEDPETAEQEGRPRRKIYRVTGEGVRTLQEAPRVGEGRTGLAEVTG
jgi:PadR family transcriptional regulator, regulatory protein PadR